MTRQHVLSRSVLLSACLLALSAQAADPVRVAGRNYYPVPGPNYSIGYSGDGGPANEAKINNPKGGIIYNGEFYFADSRNYRIRKISADGIITTVLGLGTSGSSPSGTPAAQVYLKEPSAVRFDELGRMYVADGMRLIRIGLDGIMTVVAGNGTNSPFWDGTEWGYGYSGPALQASIDKVNDFIFWKGRVFMATEAGLFNIDPTNDKLTHLSYGRARGLAINKKNELYAMATTTYVGPDQVQREAGTFMRVWFSGSAATNDGVTVIAHRPYLFVHGQQGKPMEDAQFSAGKFDFDTYGSLIFADRDNHQVSKVGVNNALIPVMGEKSARVGVHVAYPDSVVMINESSYYVTNTANSVIYKVDGNPNDGSMDTIEWASSVDGTCALDVPQEGTKKGCNPVHLVTGAKLDEEVDLINKSSYPIAWARRYHSGKGGWTFSYQRSLNVRPSASGTGRLMNLDRPDGVVLSFAQEGALDAPWTLDMGHNKSVVNVPQSILTNGVVTGYQYTNLHDEVETYDAKGKLLSLRAREGWTVTMGYDTQGRLTSATDSFGRSITITHSTPDAQGKSWITSVTDGARTVQYTQAVVNGSVQLQQVTNPLGKTTRYVYDEGLAAGRGLLTSVYDSNNNRFAKYTYDAQDRTTSTVHDPDNTPTHKTEYAYDDDTGRTDISFGSNVVSSVLSNPELSHGATKPYKTEVPCQMCTGDEAKENTYDEHGNPITSTDFNGVVTRRTYNERSLVVEEVKAADTPQQITTTTTWHPTWRLPTSIAVTKREPPGMDYETPMMTDIAYTEFGQIASITRTPKEPDAIPRTQTFEYNAQKLLRKMTDPEGNSTTYAYDGQGNITSITNALGQVTTFANYTPSGVARLITDPNGLQHKVTLNAEEKPISIAVGSDSTHWETTTITYNNLGLASKISKPNGHWTEMTYDTAKRLVSIKDPNGTHKVAYNAEGNPAREDIYNNSNQSLWFMNHTYDNAGNITKQQSVNYRDFSYDKEGNMKSWLADGGYYRQQYDALNQPTVLDYPDSQGGSMAEFNSDRLFQVTNVKGFQHTYISNSMDEVVLANNPDNGVRMFRYNKNGTMVYARDSRDVESTFTYDALGRLVGKTMTLGSSGDANAPGFASGNKTQSFVYDTCANGVGRMCSMSNDSGTTSYTYDLWGRVTSTTFVPANTSLSLRVEYAYNNAGQLVSTTYPSARVLSNQYTAGLASSASFGGQGVFNGLQYRPFGMGPTQWNWGSGTDLPFNISYTLDNQVSSVYSSEQYRVYGLNFNNGGNGKVANVSNWFNSDHNNEFDYTFGKLSSTSYSNPGNQPNDLYAYELNGSRTARTRSDNTGGMTYNVDPYSNRLLGTTLDTGSGMLERTFAYDSNGNMHQEQTPQYTQSYLYGVDNRIQRMESGGQVVQYRYNPLGQRTTKTHVGQANTEYFVHDIEGRLLGVYDAAGTPKQEFVWMEGSWRPMAVMNGNGANAALYYIESDHLGTPLLARNSTGTTVWTWMGREAFGFQAPNEDADGDGVSFTLNLRFPGQWFDSESGLFHNGFRDYDPELGRYIQADPLELQAGPNSYQYANNNPNQYIDPLGLDALDVHLKVNAGIEALDQTVVNVLGWVGAPGLPWQVVDWGAGFGDTVTSLKAFGSNTSLTEMMREEMGINHMIKCYGGLGAYSTGEGFGRLYWFGVGFFGSMRLGNAGMIMLAQSGRLPLYHHTSMAAAESIAATGFRMNKGFYGEALYATPFLKPQRYIRLLGAKSLETTVKVPRTFPMKPSYMFGNIKAYP